MSIKGKIEMISRNDRRYTIWPVCPHCGNQDTDAWQMSSLDVDDAETFSACKKCGKNYRIIAHIVKTYSTKTLEE